MVEVPSLISLCIHAIKDPILDENGKVSDVFMLPPELFDQLVPELPPLALQNLQDAMQLDDGFTPSRKRKRYEIFDIAWKVLYVSRWVPRSLQKTLVDINWQQMYWEKHLQACLDATSRAVSDTSFDGFLGDVDLPGLIMINEAKMMKWFLDWDIDSVLKHISYEGHASRSKSYAKLIYHFERFGQYARCLSLQSVHYVAEIDHLLRKCQLEYLKIQWLTLENQVDGLCKLLEKKKETLATLEFVGCNLPAHLVTTIFESLHVKGFETNVIKKFSIMSSNFLDSSLCPLPLVGFESLLTAARGLTTLVLSNNQISGITAKMLFDTLLNGESCLQVLDLSNNKITGWLSHFKPGSINCITSDQQNNKSLKSLRVLKLRGNHLYSKDAKCLRYAMFFMPNVEVLELSDNPLDLSGIRELIPYLTEKSKLEPLTELYLENCGMCCHAASELLKVLAACKVPLKSLSIGHNYLTRNFGRYLGAFLSSGIQALDVSQIALNPTGFSNAHDQIARFLSKLISESSKLASVDATGNWIPVQSFPAICSCLEAGKGKLEHFNLRYNPVCGKPDIASLLSEFQINGKPDILLSTPPPYAQPPRRTMIDNDLLDYVGDALDDI
ncbi:RNI-like superfamily protein [Artemisia annua]|uniref:RNI-like superfamily protein n=1 Tax=Artemisia annua TaxID=35608 RepID=A0A2U1N894_ARTAN|nr:RNI-like superfamily protein [Artemisia annua]